MFFHQDNAPGHIFVMTPATIHDSNFLIKKIQKRFYLFTNFTATFLYL